MQHIRQHIWQRTWWSSRAVAPGIITGIVTGVAITLLVAFRASPAPQTQRLTDLVARLDALEEADAAQQDQLDALEARLAALEATGGATPGIALSPDVTIPRTWEPHESSDGVLRYRHDPEWELTNDEPGTLDLWLDEDTAIFFTWDWSVDLLDDLHDDEEFLAFFEKDLLGSDETTQSEIIASDALQFMGDDAHYWEVRMASSDGFASRMLTVFYPCSDRTSCNVALVRFDPDPTDGLPVAAFEQDDWEFIHTFAYAVEFLTVGKTSVLANANLRACPAIDCAITDRLVRGEIIELSAISEDGYWYQLDSGAWIASNLVFGAPDDLPIISADEEI